MTEAPQFSEPSSIWRQFDDTDAANDVAVSAQFLHGLLEHILRRAIFLHQQEGHAIRSCQFPVIDDAASRDVPEVPQALDFPRCESDGA